MSDAYAETDVWPNPPATPTPAPDRTESAPDAPRVLGDAPTATDATIAALRAGVERLRAIRRELESNLQQANLWSWEQHDRAEAAEARLRAVEAERDALRAAAAVVVKAWDDFGTYEPCSDCLRSGVGLVDFESDERMDKATDSLRAALASAAPAVSGIRIPGGITPGGMKVCPECGRWGSNPGGLCTNTFHAPAVSDGEGANGEAADGGWMHGAGCSVCARGGPEAREFHRSRTDKPNPIRPVSPVVASSATEAPQAPAEQEGRKVPEFTPRSQSSDRCSCGSPEAYSLNPAETVVHRLDGPCCIAPSVRPATADDEGVRRG